MQRQVYVLSFTIQLIYFYFFKIENKVNNFLN